MDGEQQKAYVAFHAHLVKGIRLHRTEKEGAPSPHEPAPRDIFMTGSPKTDLVVALLFNTAWIHRETSQGTDSVACAERAAGVASEVIARPSTWLSRWERECPPFAAQVVVHAVATCEEEDNWEFSIDDERAFLVRDALVLDVVRHHGLHSPLLDPLRSSESLGVMYRTELARASKAFAHSHPG